MRKQSNPFAIVISAVAVFSLFACTSNAPTEQKKETTSMSEASSDPVQRGKYLVAAAACNDCHSPKNMTPQGPVPDTTKLLSGHPANSTLPPVDLKATKPGQWMLMAPDITAFVGPWGISYTANLTPDSATGIGAWPEESFIKAMRTGKHLGNPTGRDILPPMPWQYLSKLTDDDLKAIFAYLKSLPPIKNQVPQPVPPNQAGKK